MLRDIDVSTGNSIDIIRSPQNVVRNFLDGQGTRKAE